MLNMLAKLMAGRSELIDIAHLVFFDEIVGNDNHPHQIVVGEPAVFMTCPDCMMQKALAW